MVASCGCLKTSERGKQLTSGCCPRLKYSISQAPYYLGSVYMNGVSFEVASVFDVVTPCVYTTQIETVTETDLNTVTILARNLHCSIQNREFSG